jgi:hypothetical protein
MRQRARTTTGTFISDGSDLKQVSTSSEVYEYMLDEVGSRLAHHPALHIRYVTRARGICRDSSSLNNVTDLPVSLKASNACALWLREIHALPPKFIRNNSFDLVPFLAELDDTLAMFSLKFIKRFSYGSFTWGIMPFLNDVRALADSYSDIINGYEYNFTRSHSIETVWKKKSFNMISVFDDAENILFECSGKVRINGSATANLDLARSKVNHLYFLLDEVGANPDPAAFWDALPLSFVVDYFVNIGEALEELHPRGWAVYDWSAYGYHTYQAHFKHQVRTLSGSNSGLWSSGEMFIRTGLGPILVSNQRETNLTFKSPSLRQWFNVTYLFTFLGKLF